MIVYLMSRAVWLGLSLWHRIEIDCATLSNFKAIERESGYVKTPCKRLSKIKKTAQ